MFKRSDFDDTHVKHLPECIKGNIFLLSLYYVVSLLWL